MTSRAASVVFRRIQFLGIATRTTLRAANFFDLFLRQPEHLQAQAADFALFADFLDAVFFQRADDLALIQPIRPKLEVIPMVRSFPLLRRRPRAPQAAKLMNRACSVGSTFMLPY